MRISYISQGKLVLSPCLNRYKVVRAVVEEWWWLIREGLVVPTPECGNADEFDFSKHGYALTNAQQFAKTYGTVSTHDPTELAKLLQKAWVNS